MTICTTICGCVKMWKKFNNPSQYSRIFDQEHDCAQIRKFCKHLWMNWLTTTPPVMNLLTHCFDTAEAWKQGKNLHAFEPLFAVNRRLNSMRWGDSTQKTRQKRLSDNEYFSKMKIWNYEINLQKYGCSSTDLSLKSSVVEQRMKWIIWINATRKCTQSADRL